MLKTVTAKHIQDLDRIAIEKFGIPSIVLMENAGKAAAEHIQTILKRKKQRQVVIVCGTGNNGGDGFVIARHLWNADIAVKLYIIGNLKHLKTDALVNFSILRKLGIKVQSCLFTVKEIRRSVVVDALFGVGLNRTLSEPFVRTIDLINREAKYVIAIDVPSGLNATTGAVWGICIAADETLTFTYAKKGCFNGEGKKLAGHITVIDIGIPEKIKRQVR